jgi:hypothetical protein
LVQVQTLVKHSRSWCRASSTPPLQASWITVRSRVAVPWPHVVEHADQPAPHPVTTRSYAAPEAQAFAWYSASWVAASTEEAMAARSGSEE